MSRQRGADGLRYWLLHPARTRPARTLIYTLAVHAALSPGLLSGACLQSIALSNYDYAGLRAPGPPALLALE